MADDEDIAAIIIDNGSGGGRRYLMQEEEGEERMWLDLDNCGLLVTADADDEEEAAVVNEIRTDFQKIGLKVNETSRIFNCPVKTSSSIVAGASQQLEQPLASAGCHDESSGGAALVGLSAVLSLVVVGLVTFLAYMIKAEKEGKPIFASSFRKKQTMMIDDPFESEGEQE